MDWTVDEQQRVEAWFFDDATTPRVVRCAWSNDQSQLVDCRTAMSGAQLKSNGRSLAVHLAVDRAGQRVFIADAKGARVQSFDLEGKPLVSTNPQDVPLSFPNRLRYLGNDTLVVADNDHRRLAWLQVTAGQPPKLGRTLASADHGQARKGRGKVTDVAFGPDGTVWMLAMKQGQKDGDVLVFDAQQRPVARAALSDDSDPIIIEALGDNTAIAADYSLIKLHHIDAQGRNLGEFGDAAFRGELQPLQDAAQAGTLWQRGAMVAGGIIIALGLVLGLLFGQKPKKPGQFDSQAKAALVELAGDREADTTLRFPVVLRQTDAYRANIRKQILGLILVALALPVVLMVVPSFFAGDVVAKLMGSWKTLGLAMVAATVPACGALAVWFTLYRPGELRVTQNKIGWFRGDKLVSSTPLTDAYASTNALLVGHVTIRFRLPALRPKSMPTMFDMDIFNRAVLARVPVRTWWMTRRWPGRPSRTGQWPTA